MSDVAIYERFRLNTLRRFGTVVCPHLFRHSAATSIANEAPEDMHIIATVLGHTSLEQAETH